ncbi:beta-ketoacyl synthase N-terminal-like domain-containing protein [Fictibacillus phosphorivorans]|uniref:beta-ketoacyl synthase N-terminal-like domain-containing protein n=1 Tax=Fictibacillus phosphorivorans TaxID=1221500 RepID=UPI003CE671BC
MEGSRNGIAVIGIACRLPGANNKDEFWWNLKNGVNSIKDIPTDRWDINKYYSSNFEKDNKTISKWCGLLNDVNMFDNKFFNISPREANHMDPQQRILLEETWKCIEDSGVSLSSLQEKITSVYIGVMTADYREKVFSHEVNIDSYSCLGSFEAILSNRISHIFQFKGASMSINAACASSLVAIHEAKRSLEFGESQFAIAGGVSLNLHPGKYISFSKSRMLSPDGQCKTFDVDANGYVPGDGAGLLLLQPLEDAIRDGNHIYGIIKGSGVNHNGGSHTITAPKVGAQKEVILSALKDADINPETVTYIEAHGTGTSLGDPIEVEALKSAYRDYTDLKQYCQIGSVKTNIGHLEAAAGIAGTIKVLMMMKYKMIPPTLNLKIENPIIDFKNSPFVLATKTSDWMPKEPMPLRAGVSSFGFGGVNAHVLIEEFPIAENDSIDEADQYPFILSAKNLESLESLKKDWYELIDSNKYSNFRLRDIVSTLSTGRQHFKYRTGFLVTNHKDIEQSILTTPTHIVNTNQKNSIITGRLVVNGYSCVKNLFDNYPYFNKKFTAIEEKINSLSPDLLKSFKASPWPEELVHTYNFVFEIIFLEVVRMLGYDPNLIIPGQDGLWSALAYSGIATEEDILLFIAGKKKPEEMKFSQPEIPFFDPTTNRIIEAEPFGSNYIQKLTIGLEEQLEIEDELLEKANLLLEKQFTFKKYMEEWANEVKKIADKSLYDMLMHKLSQPSGSNKKLTREDCLLVLIILDCQRALHNKWNLSQYEIKNGQARELLNLLSDQALTKQAAVQLFLNREPDYEKINKSLSSRKHFLDWNKDYHYLTLEKNSGTSCSITSSWIIELIKFNKNQKEKNLDYLNTATSINIAKLFKQFKSKETEGKFIELLIYLWLKGVAIKWSDLYEIGSFNKLSLPVYKFNRRTFKLPIEVISDQNKNEHSAAERGKADLLNVSKRTRADMNSNIVDLEIVSGAIAIIKMNDSKNKNMFTQDLLIGLEERFKEVERNKNIKVVIITGQEKIFSMGGTQKQLEEISDMKKDFSTLSFIYEGPLNCRVPVIAAIQGHAVGGGLTLGLYADMIIMANDGVYSANYLNYGFTPGLGTTFIFKEKMGSVLANELMYTARGYLGEELRRRGAPFIFQDGKDVLPSAINLAKTIADKPEYAVRVLKQELSGRLIDELRPIVDKEIKMHNSIFSQVEKEFVSDRINFFFKSKKPEEIISNKELSSSVVNLDNSKEQVDLLDYDIVKYLANTLDIPQNEIDLDASFKELGLDSITGVELVREINKKYKSSIETTAIYSYATVKDFINFASKEINGIDHLGLLPEVKNDSEKIVLSSNFPKIEHNAEKAVKKVKLHPTESINLLNRGADSSVDYEAESMNLILIKTLGEILHVQEEDISRDDFFKEIGIDSISGVEFIREVNKLLNINLDTTVIYDYKSVRELSGYIQRKTIDSDLLKSNEETNTATLDIQKEITNIISHVLSLSIEHIEIHDNFKELGIDSISGVEVIRDINKAFGISLEAISLYDYSTIKKLTDLIEKEINHVTVPTLNNYKQLQVVREEETDNFTDLFRQLQDGKLDIDEVDRLMEVYRGNLSPK